MAYIYNGILLSHKMNEIMSFSSTQMDLEIIILSEVKSGWDRQISYDITYTWNLKKNQLNELLYKTETDSQRHRKQTYGYQRRKRGRDKLGVLD